VSELHDDVMVSTLNVFAVCIAVKPVTSAVYSVRRAISVSCLVNSVQTVHSTKFRYWPDRLFV